MPEDNHWKAYHLVWNTAQIYGYGCNPTAPSSSLQKMQVKLFGDNHIALYSPLIFVTTAGCVENLAKCKIFQSERKKLL